MASTRWFSIALLASTASHAAADTYEKVGNGWCVDGHGRRLKLGPDSRTHAADIKWQRADVSPEGHARRCEQMCSRLDDCIGYMTEDGSACDIVRRGDHYAGGGIAAADRETRNFCWMRMKADAVDAASSCEAFASWPDGRKERRECVALA